MKYTFEQQFNKLTREYIEDKIQPWHCKHCFVGNMLDHNNAWGAVHSSLRDSRGSYGPAGSDSDIKSGIEIIKHFGYTVDETRALEDNFLTIINKKTRNTPSIYNRGDIKITSSTRSRTGEWVTYATNILEDKTLHPNYENALFEAFESTLTMLKMIHARNGDFSGDTRGFVKRTKTAQVKC